MNPFHRHNNQSLVPRFSVYAMGTGAVEKDPAQHVEAGSLGHLESTPEAIPRPWYKQSELRKLYINIGFLFLASSTLGYDGSLLNGLQTMTTWQTCTFTWPLSSDCSTT